MTVKLNAFRPRPLADAKLPSEGEIFKCDRRSRVWQVEVGGRCLVIKRFEYAPWRQRLALAVGNHPAQRELSCNDRLRRAQVPVVPVIDGGVETSGLGCRAWLATAWSGQSLQRLLKQPALDHQHQCEVDAAAVLTRCLIEAGFWCKDLKPSNIVLDVEGQARLIDVGSARRRRQPNQIDRMLAVMDRVFARDGVVEELRTRYAAAVRDGSVGG